MNTVFWNFIYSALHTHSFGGLTLMSTTNLSVAESVHCTEKSRLTTFIIITVKEIK